MSRRGILVAVGAFVLLPSLPAQALTGTITGTVVNAAGRPVPYACVHLAADRYDYNYFGDAETDGQGRFRFSFVADRPYKVFVEPCWPVVADFSPEWYGDAYTFYEAEPVHAGPLETVDLQITVGSGALLRGTVSDVATGAPVQDVCVAAYPAEYDDPFFVESWDSWGRSPVTDDDGAFAIRNLMPGPYRVRYSWCGSTSDPGYVHDFLTEPGTDQIALLEGPNDGDKALARAGGIRGIVASATPGFDGQPTCARAILDAEHEYPFGIATDVTYRMEALPPGEYLVVAGGCEGFDRVWYPDAIDEADAERVTVRAGEWTREIDLEVTYCVRADDFDDDGLDDCAERRHGTEYWLPDTDYDGLSDGDEVLVYDSDPHAGDTDGDLFGDGFEVHGGECVAGDFEGGSDPTDATSTPVASVDAVPIGQLPRTIFVLCSRPGIPPDDEAS